MGSQLGAGTHWSPPPPAATARPAFTGAVRLGCKGVDFNAFLQGYRPRELLSEMRNTLLSGAQAEVANFLITLSYASPSVSSVLDMMDKRYAARYAGFAQACASHSARPESSGIAPQWQADAGDQCFDRAVSSGAAPSEAYRQCYVARSYGGMDIPAAASTPDFSRRYTNSAPSQRLESLLWLLPDTQLADGGLRMRPPRTSLGNYIRLLRNAIRTALDSQSTGGRPAAVADCDATALLDATVAGYACLPSTGRALVSTPAFASALRLGPNARTLFYDALASRLALAEANSGLLELLQWAGSLDARSDSGVDAEHTMARRKVVTDGVRGLLDELEAQRRLQAGQAELIQDQVLALERVGRDSNRAARNLDTLNERPGVGFRDWLKSYAGGN